MAAAQGSVSVEAREEREREGAEQGVSSLRGESEVGPGEGSGEERGQLSQGRLWVFPRHHETPMLDL